MFYAVLVAYILGGLTFIPFIALGGLAFAFFTAEPFDTPSVKPRVCHANDIDVAEEKSSSTPSSTATKPRAPTLKTWLTVRRTFEASPSSYISLVRTLLDARSAHPRRSEDAYYAVLKGAILYLYEDEAMSECAAAIDVARCHVGVFPEQGLLDGELFAKRNALLIREMANGVDDKDGNLIGSDSGEHQGHPPAQSPPWFIFFRSVTLMEDWYLALLSAPFLSSPSPSSTASSIPPSTFAPYPYAAHQALISSLDALPDLIPTRWLNALLGRLFLGVKGTRAVEQWVIGRLMKKLAKVKTPGFLSAVVVRSFDAGTVAPVLSKPMLKELTPEGETSVGVDVSYAAPPGGEMRITISATATISIPGTASLSLLGFSSGRGKDKEREQDNEKDKEKQGEEGTTKAKDKSEIREKDSQRPYEVSLVLAIVVHRLEGNVLFKIKRPPSNRLWYAFTTAPHMEITVEPVVSDRRVRWGMVLAAIEGKLKEIIQESVVLPYMDDIPFFDTTSYALRGGIFAEAFTEAGREEATASAMSNSTATTTIATTTTSTSESTSAGTTPAIPATDQISRTHNEVTHAANALGSTSPKPIHHTRSADALVAREQHTANNGDQGSMRAEANGAIGGARKRRTWLGKTDGSGDDVAAENGYEQRMWSQEREGRDETVKILVTQDKESQDAIKRPLQAHSPRATSTSGSSPSTEDVTRQRLSTSAPSSASSHFPPASPSASSSPRDHSPTRPRSEQGSATSALGPPLPATPSFFSTLKSRSAGMAEKPVLKEAMRKWGVGVNWAAGLRKDGRDKDRESAREKEWDRDSGLSMDMEADHGEFWKGGREASDAEGRRRGTYAELRRKVEERERERLGNGSRGSNDSENGSRPIDIPGTERVGDVPSSKSSSRPPSVRSETSSSSVRRVSPQGVSGNGFLNPSAPRTTTELHTAVPIPSSPSLHTEPFSSEGSRQHPESIHNAIFLPPPLDEPMTPTFTTPIRAQPKAATMTIPGIHARHRGEVMALGSEPLKPEEASEAKGMTSDGEGRAGTGKTIQSMYRLLRGGNAQASASMEGVSQGLTGVVESGGRASPSMVASDPHPRPSVIPPPLPPRSSTHSSPVQPSSSTSEREVDSPASQALKNVAQQDAARQPPLLPMRRASGMSFRSTDAMTASSSPASLSSSSSASMVPSPSSPSDPEGSWLALTPEQEVKTPSSAAVITPSPTADGREKWRPPLPPRRSTSGVNIVQA